MEVQNVGVDRCTSIVDLARPRVVDWHSVWMEDNLSHRAIRVDPDRI